MASTFFGLTIGTSGLFASKSGLNVTAHNIANVETEGFSKQYINQRADTALRTNNHYGMLGTGAKVVSTDQSRSQYYDEKYRSNNAIAGKYEERYYFMKEIESYLNEIQLEGFTVSFDNMYNSLQELAKDSSSLTVRTQVVNYSAQLSDYFNSMYTNLQRVQEECNYEIKNQVQKINSYAGQIATLTKQINTVEVGGENANDLRDQRNLLVDELSNIINVTCIEQEVGTAGMHAFIVRIDGNTLVDTYETHPLSVVPRDYKRNQCDVDGLYDIYWENGDEFKPASGTLNGVFKALFEVRDGNNEEALKGTLSEALEVIPQSVQGSKEVTMLSAVPDNKAQLNPTGQVNVGGKYYNYTSYTVAYAQSSTVNGVTTDYYSYKFTLADEIDKDYQVGTTVISGNAFGRTTSALTGKVDPSDGGKTITISGCNINDVKDLNIPLAGHLKVGNGEYDYDSFEVNVTGKDANGNDIYEYKFNLTTAIRRAYDKDTPVTIGADVDYKGIPYYMAQLNQFLRTFTESYNQIHCSGEDLDGNKGENFFSCHNQVTGEEMMLTALGDPANGYMGSFSSTDSEEGAINTNADGVAKVSYYRLTAENFCISKTMTQDVRKLVTTSDIRKGVGSNDIAQQLIALKSDRSMFKQGDPAEFLETLVAEVGIDTKAAKDSSQSQTNILATVQNQRLSVAGVDTDEEAMNLVRYQEAYSLNAKVISVMQEIYDKLINETGL